MDKYSLPENIKGRIGIFELYNDRLLPQLVLETNYIEIMTRPDFHHWGTQEFNIEIGPIIENKEYA